ncbi:WhiB family transcriptional regulator [Nocardioides antri]
MVAVTAVLVECRAYALASRERHGVWGGTTPADRRAGVAG